MSDTESRLVAAQAAIRAGRKQEARNLLKEELEHNPESFRAWLWLAGLADSAQASIDYVQQAERLNANDPGVKKARRWAEQRLAQQASLQKSSPPATAAPSDALELPPSAPDTTAVADETTQRVDALRDRQRAETGQVAAPGRRRLFFGAVALFLVGLLLSALLWGDDALQLVLAPTPTPVAIADRQVATPTVTAPAMEPQADGEIGTMRLVSGQFLPRERTGSPAELDTNEPVDSNIATATPSPAPLEPKPVNKTDSPPRATWTLTPSPTYTPTATPTPVPTFVREEQVVQGNVTRPLGVGPNERWIDVNLTSQSLVAYEGDRAVFNSLVSSGTWLHPTVTGQFRVWLRYTAQTMDGSRLGYDYYLPNVPYVMYFYRDYALHGTYWHNNFGTPMSHGCVNLPTPAAEWIFNWSSIGTLVNVHY